MKVLFAVNNENISESIIKKYQQEYKEIISAKNVYYFNAIIKELQKDKTYERIIISEDLQPFSNNNFDTIDKFIFEKMDNISDEATNQSGNDIPIILICTDRRGKSDPLLVKLFGIGVYNALLEKDRSITNVCELLAHPRTKKEAKLYYRVDSDDVDYKVENEGDVSEVEIQNILNHYKKLGRNEDKYVESFDHIASQYTDSQLRLISQFLPLNVKAVLEANSTKYQEVVSFGSITKKTTPNYNDYSGKNKKASAIKNESKQDDNVHIDLIEKNLSKNKMKEPVIIPSSINTNNVKKVQVPNVNARPVEHVTAQQPIDQFADILDVPQIEKKEIISEVEEETVSQVETAEPKRRGRPRKVQKEDTTKLEVNPQPKRGRGRPRKIQEIPEIEETTRELDNTDQVEEKNEPAVILDSVSQEPLNLFELGEEQESVSSPVSNTSDEMILPGLEDQDMILPGLGNDDMILPGLEPEETILPGFEDEENSSEPIIQENTSRPNINSQRDIVNTNISNTNLSGLLTKDKKIVAFVGTSKNGTSFLVNNLAEMLSQKGINTAILDLTQNKNAYYIYTENEEHLRKTAYSCINNLKNGNPQGIEVHKNLTVYTSLPGENEGIEDYSNILETLIKNYSLVLLDCDFETNYGYFKEAQELYLVQGLDVLTIQPLTAFLRNLKAKEVLNPEKIRVVLNKVVKLRSITERNIIGGMAFYNDPAMSFMTELFNKDTVPYCSIPFEEQTYSKYLEALINCKITLNGYSKNFIATLTNLSNMVYPLINNSKNYSYKNYSTNNNFSSDMNNTLNKMKNSY